MPRTNQGVLGLAGSISPEFSSPMLDRLKRGLRALSHTVVTTTL